jgi:hypothetical protein
MLIWHIFTVLLIVFCLYVPYACGLLTCSNAKQTKPVTVLLSVKRLLYALSATEQKSTLGRVVVARGLGGGGVEPSQLLNQPSQRTTLKIAPLQSFRFPKTGTPS